MTGFYYCGVIYLTIALLTSLFVAVITKQKPLLVIANGLLWPIFWFVGVITYIETKK